MHWHDEPADQAATLIACEAPCRVWRTAADTWNALISVHGHATAAYSFSTREQAQAWCEEQREACVKPRSCVYWGRPRLPVALRGTNTLLRSSAVPPSVGAVRRWSLPDGLPGRRVTFCTLATDWYHDRDRGGPHPVEPIICKQRPHQSDDSLAA